MQFIIGNLDENTRAEDIQALLVDTIGAEAPQTVQIENDTGNCLAIVNYPADSNPLLGKVLVEKLNGFLHNGRMLNAALTHTFKD